MWIVVVNADYLTDIYFKKLYEEIDNKPLNDSTIEGRSCQLKLDRLAVGHRQKSAKTAELQTEDKQEQTLKTH